VLRKSPDARSEDEQAFLDAELASSESGSRATTDNVLADLFLAEQEGTLSPTQDRQKNELLRAKQSNTTDRELARIYGKIREEGFASLTAAERQLLATDFALQGRTNTFGDPLRLETQGAEPRIEAVTPEFPEEAAPAEPGPGATPSRRPTRSGLSPRERVRALDNARAAVRAGAPVDQVRQRLLDLGIDIPLDLQ
jgi:hypothetical protein